MPPQRQINTIPTNGNRDIRDNRTNNDLRSSVSSQNTQTHIPLLEYPRNFFHQETGAGPNTPEEAKLLWMYRKNRRQDGLADTEEANGEAMITEIKKIRESLRAHILETYNEGIGQRARELNILIPGKASHPVTTLDFRNILNELECTPDNQRLVFELVHQFHKDRHWLANAIDKWFLKEGMCLMPQQKAKFVNGKRTRLCPTDRGGFSAVARSAKSQVVAGLMVPMLRNAGWSVALTKGQSKKNNYETKVRYNASTHFYVVNQKEKVSWIMTLMIYIFHESNGVSGDVVPKRI